MDHLLSKEKDVQRGCRVIGVPVQF